MKNLLPKRALVRSPFGLVGVFLLLFVFPRDALSDAPDTLDLLLQWAYPIAVTDLKVVDFDGDGINEILVGFNSDSARAGILDPVDQTWVWQSPGLDGSMVTVAAGDRNDDGFPDIVCGGQRSDTSIGYIEIFDGPDFDSAHTLPGFDEKVLSAAVSARGSDSLPEILLGTYLRQEISSELGTLDIMSGRLYVLDGQNLAVEDVSGGGTVRDILVGDFNSDTRGELFLGMDYVEIYSSILPVDYVILRSWINHSFSDYSDTFYLYNIWQDAAGYWVSFDALDAGSFDNGLTTCIIASGRVDSWIQPKAKLACWNGSTAELEWSIQWDYDLWGDNFVADLAVLNFDSEKTEAICAAYRNGLIELKSALDGSNLSISPPLDSIYHLEAGNVDQDSFIEICVTSADSLYVYETEFITTDVHEIGDHLPPDDFCLLQNYPNPFNPNTNIRFSVPVASNVTVAIYNILGQKIRTFEQRCESGTHTFRWDGRNSSGEEIASGVYLYKLSAGSHQEIRKMVLLR